MPRRLYLAYPALLAVIPVLYRQAQNVGHALIIDAVLLSLVLAVAIALAQLVCYGVLRLAARVRPNSGAGDGAADWAALLATGVVVLFYLWPAASDGFYSLAARYPLATRGVAAVAVVALTAGLWWGVRRGHARRLTTRVLPAAGRYVALMALLLVAWSAAQLAASPIRLARITRESAAIRDLARPVPLTHAATAASRRPDVYVIVLDEYAGAEALRQVYGIDNTPFVDSLRALGFRVPSHLRSNYPVTLVSVASLLNFAQLQPLTRDLPAGYRDYALGTYLLEHNRAARFLKAQGYRFAFYPSAWYAPTRHNREADYEQPRPAQFDVARAIYSSDLVQSFVDGTLLRRLVRYVPTMQEVRGEFALRTLADVAALAARPAGGPPVFAVAHVLVPHQPFILDAACRPYPRGTELFIDAPPESPQVRATLTAYLTCLNRRVLATVRTILARPGQRPVIILQGDHGTQGLAPFATPADSLSVAQVRERFSPFGAYYLPDGGAAAMPDTVSIVNVLRTVFRYYHGAELPPVPNQMYFSDVDHPYRLTEIDTLTDRPAVTRR